MITCLHTCVSTLIWKMFGVWSSSPSELTPTWLCETPALIGPTCSNYRLLCRGAWHSQSAGPAKRPCFWGRKWPYMGTPLDLWLKVRLCGSPLLLTYNNLALWLLRKHRIRLWILLLLLKTEQERRENEGAEEGWWQQCSPISTKGCRITSHNV